MISSLLIDSNVFISLLRRGRDPVAVLGGWAYTNHTNLITCGMVRLEVLRGIKVEKVFSMMTSFFDVMENVSTDDNTWESAALLAWELDRQGRILPAQDLLIAAIARRTDSAVLTDDKHFENIPHLTVIPSPF
jgi:predicted nucleic acid-binding protein